MEKEKKEGEQRGKRKKGINIMIWKKGMKKDKSEEKGRKGNTMNENELRKAKINY